MKAIGAKGVAGPRFCLPRRGTDWFKVCVTVPPDLDGLSATELRELAVKLSAEAAELKRQIPELLKERARLRRLKGRRNSKPETWKQESSSS